MTYHQCIAASWLGMAVSMLFSHADTTWAETKAELTLESPRRAFYRGEVVLMVVKVANIGESSLADSVLNLKLAECVERTSATFQLARGEERRLSFRLPTAAIRSGVYKLNCTLMSKNLAAAAELTEPIIIGPQLKPDQMLIWLWGGSGNQWYLDHGFTSWSGVPSAVIGRQYNDNVRRALDQALPTGAAASLSPNGGLTDIDPSAIEDPDAINLAVREHRQGKIANPFHPEVVRLQNEANRRMMEFAKDYPQVKTAFFNTEVVDQLGNNRNQAGLALTKETLGFSEDELGEPKFVAPGVIADDDRHYLFHKYKFKQGNGLAQANQRTADMVHRYRPDILTINDPYRYTSLLDMFPEMDVVSTWTYTKPDPKLMLAIETLRAVCKPSGQTPLHTITMLNYPGAIAPTDQWMLMGPGRVAVTSWINLSRASKMIGYYYSSACPPDGKLSEFQVPYATSLKIKELAERVYKPYGPMITNLAVTPRRIALLSSAAAIVHRANRSLYGYANMQIYPFYTVLAMAHLQADVVFDETIDRFGLDDYDVLVLPQCDTLPESVYHKILRFRERGGVVISDQFLRAEIPGAITFDFDFTYRSKVSADAIVKNETYAKWNDQLQPESAEMEKVVGITALDDQRFMETYAKKLAAKLAGIVDPEVDCDTPKVLFNMLEYGNANYLVAINDNRTYDDRVGQYKAVLGKLLPQQTTVSIHRWEHQKLFAYDMLEQKLLEVTRHGNSWQFDLALTDLGGKMVALYPHSLENVQIQMPSEITRGTTSSLRITLQDDTSAPPSGLQPLEVAITDSQGRANEFQGYYCAKNGLLDLQFIAAKNDALGQWAVSVTDLTAGLTAKAKFEVVE